MISYFIIDRFDPFNIGMHVPQQLRYVSPRLMDPIPIYKLESLIHLLRYFNGMQYHTNKYPGVSAISYYRKDSMLHKDSLCIVSNQFQIKFNFKI